MMRMMTTVLTMGIVTVSILGCGGSTGAPSSAPAAAPPAAHGPNDGHGHDAVGATCEHGVAASSCEKCKAEGHAHDAAAGSSATRCEHGIDAALCAECSQAGHAHESGGRR